MRLFGHEITNVWGVTIWLVAYSFAFIALIFILVRDNLKRRKRR